MCARPQALAIAIESCRLVLVQRLLQGFGLDPIASLYYMAPVRPFRLSHLSRGIAWIWALTFFFF